MAVVKYKVLFLVYPRQFTAYQYSLNHIYFCLTLYFHWRMNGHCTKKQVVVRTSREPTEAKSKPERRGCSNYGPSSATTIYAVVVSHKKRRIEMHYYCF